MIVNNIDNYIKENNIKQIYLDVDGVILHTCQALVDILNERYETDFKGEDVLKWNVDNLYPNIENEEIEQLFTNPRLFDVIEFVDGVKDFIKRHEKNITIVTKGRIDNYRYKKALFEINDLNVPIICLPIEVSKGLINMKYGLFIDDSVSNLKESDATYKIMFKEYNDDKIRDWQTNWDGDVMYDWSI